MNHPIIHDAYFFGATDAAINSKVIRQIFNTMMVSYQRYDDSFVGMLDAWGIRIEDKHDDEEAPHYRLKIGEGDFANLKRTKYNVRYVDYRSLLNLEQEGRAIETAPGMYSITVWMPIGYNDDARRMVIAEIDDAYYKAMTEVLPDYAILVSELIEEH
jgi:hypothetical protein